MSNNQLDNKCFSCLVSQNNLSPADFDKQLRASLRKTYPKKRISLAAAAVPGPAGPGGAARVAGCPILDTHTQECEKSLPRKPVSVKFFTRRMSRSVFSRTMMGMCLPGRYYFLTLTSSPESPPIKKSFNKLRMWLKKERPGISWIVVFTAEGFGVIHMVFRLPLRSKNIDVRLLRARWKKWHKATQIKILRASSDHEKLANYLADQRKLRKLGSEMSWQDDLTSWGWSSGWIPKGFTKEFGRLYVDWIDAPEELRKKVIRDSINIAAVREKKELMRND